MKEVKRDGWDKIIILTSQQLLGRLVRIATVQQLYSVFLAPRGSGACRQPSERNTSRRLDTKASVLLFQTSNDFRWVA